MQKQYPIMLKSSWLLVNRWFPYTTCVPSWWITLIPTVCWDCSSVCVCPYCCSTVISHCTRMYRNPLNPSILAVPAWTQTAERIEFLPKRIWTGELLLYPIQSAACPCNAPFIVMDSEIVNVPNWWSRDDPDYLCSWWCSVILWIGNMTRNIFVEKRSETKLIKEKEKWV